MIELRRNKWTLDKIGIFFGVSRERVRQIIGNTGALQDKSNVSPSKAGQVLFAKSFIDDNIHLTTTDVRKIKETKNSVFVGLWGKVRHNVEEGAIKKGYSVENYVSGELTKAGINHTLTNSRPYDIILSNGKTVEIRSRHKSEHYRTSKNFYSFPLGQKFSMKNPADYFILVIVIGDNKDCFVIPKDDVPPCRSVGFVWPRTRPFFRTDWSQYHNRFDLLKG